MKVFVTGVSGQLGHDVMQELASRGIEAVGSDIAPAQGGAYVSLDITDGAAVRETLRAQRPDAVIHCAAWTAVDAAEDADKQERVQAVNAEGTRHIAQACREIGCKLMYISTDYVFDGRGRNALAAGLHGLRAAERLRPNKAGRGAGGLRAGGAALHRAHRMGVRAERPELRAHDAPPGADARHAARGARSDRHADVYAGSGAPAGRHDPDRAVWPLSRHKRRRLHQLVRLCAGDLPPGGHERERPAGDDGGVWRLEGKTSLQQPVG